MSKINEQALQYAIMDVLAECRTWAAGQFQAEHQLDGEVFDAMVDSHITRRIIQMLQSTGVIDVVSSSTAQGSPNRADDRLQKAARKGFSDGREPQTTSAPKDSSATKPETYEQLQLPGMEDL